MSSTNNYVYYIEKSLVYIEDPEVKELILDIAKLLHDLEWFHESVQDSEQCEIAVYKFRKKWFCKNRNDKLQKYLDTMLDDMRKEVDRLLIGRAVDTEVLTSKHEDCPMGEAIDGV